METKGNYLKSVHVDAQMDSTEVSKDLHSAAQEYNCEKLQRLIEVDGVDVNVQRNGETVLHALLKDEFKGHLNEGKMVQCLEYLLTCPKINTNATDKNGETALSLSVANGFEKCAMILVKKGAKTYIRSEKFRGMCRLPLAIAQKMPSVMIEVLNSGITLKNTENPEVMINWSPILQRPPEVADPTEENNMRRYKTQQRETAFLYSLLDVPLNIRNDYLTHPLVTAYMWHKSKAFSKKHGGFLMLLGTYPVFYMLFIYFLYFERCKFHVNLEDNTTEEGYSSTMKSEASEHRQSCYSSTPVSVGAYILAIIAGGFALVEVYMQLRVDTRYLRNWRTWVLRVSLVIIAVTLWPALQFGTVYDITWQYPIAALGTFFSWVMFLLQLELIPQVKIYLEMLVTITLSVLKITVLFLPLLIGFYMGFNLVFFEIGGVMNFILMAVDSGSDEYETIIGKAKDDQIWFTIVAYVFSFGFLLIITIVFMNFLLGVSINDIQELKTNAKIMARSHVIQRYFVMDLLLPNWYNVTGADMSKTYVTYKPNDNSQLSEPIRKDLTKLLKRRYQESVKLKFTEKHIYNG